MLCVASAISVTLECSVDSFPRYFRPGSSLPDGSRTSCRQPGHPAPVRSSDCLLRWPQLGRVLLYNDPPPPSKPCFAQANPALHREHRAAARVSQPNPRRVSDRSPTGSALGIDGRTLYDYLIAFCALKAGADVIYTWNLKHFQQFGPEILGRLQSPQVIL